MNRDDHLWVDLPGARAVFTARRGGVSTGPYTSLNLGRWTDDRPEDVESNRVRLADSLGVAFAYGRQVHRAHIEHAAGATSMPVEADGQATALAGVAPMVLVADCLPIALAGDGVVAMLHAGWRGLAAGIVREGVAALRELGARGPVAAAIGPGAGPCCYKVDDELRARFEGFGRGRNLDLKAIARDQLGRAGVETVHDVGLCTICDESFFSHRRDAGVTGRQAGIVWLS